MEKIAVIIYHKNVESIYSHRWITECIDSIRNQTFQHFDVFELNYGNADKFYFPEDNKRLVYRKKLDLTNHIHAMNHLIESALQLDYDIIFNVNLDDTFSPVRFIKQYEKIKQGYDIVSSNFWYTNDRGVRFKKMNMIGSGDIGLNLKKNHNVIAHPCVCFNKSFFNTGLRYKDLIGYEDLDLWKRAYAEGKRFFIIDDYLLNYRLHVKQVTKTHKAK